MTTVRYSWVLSAGLLLSLAGCGGGGGDNDSATAGTESGTGDTGANETGTASNTGDGDGDPTGDGDGDGDGDPGDGDGDPGGVCGDGQLDPGEECDDGDSNGDVFACLTDCTLNVCGDGFVGPEEGCDDSNTVDGDGCSATCLLENLDPEVILCGNKVYECGDTIDNDNDGLIDLNDPECISPCDDDETTFKTNLPGQNNDCKGDCYFDQNSGGGDDHCEWNLQCDPQNPGADIGCEYDPNLMMCGLEMPPECLDFCDPLVPNGCDCFGCCEINGQFVYLGGGECSLDNLDACGSCTFFENCNNPCMPEECELCFGQDPADLPDGCVEPSCPDGVTPCMDINDCEIGQFCQTGCCIPLDPG